MPVCSLAENMITAVSSKATNVSIHTTTTSGATTSVGTTTGSVVAGQSGNTIPSTEVVSSPEQTHSLRNSRTRPLRANSDCNPPDMYSAASISIYPVRSNDAQDDASMTVGDRSQIHIATSSILFRNTLRLIFVVLTTVCAAYVPCFGLVNTSLSICIVNNLSIYLFVHI